MMIHFHVVLNQQGYLNKGTDILTIRNYAKKIIFIALSEYHHDDILAKEILFISQRFHSELCLCYKQQQSGAHLVCGSCQLEAEQRRRVGELLQTLISFPLPASRSHLASHTHIHIFTLFFSHLVTTFQKPR